MSETELQLSPAEEATELPASLTIFKFAASRGKEIEVMKKTLATKSGTKLAFQKLPKHMRRRAMSHNVKRLPRRIREIHLNQMKKSGLPPKQRRPSRKYRRRPYNLISDYMRRQRRVGWLNTHIWHAKRFHMIERWGYKLPERPCDRSFKACYRATVSHCLLQDISYYNCVEIKGNYDIIVDNFNKITDPKTGLTIAARCFIGGNREGAITIFKNDETKKAVGTVYFHWNPEEFSEKRALWVWIHAAYYSELLDVLIHCFKLRLVNIQVDSNNVSLYKSVDATVELKELKFELNRFRLTGPLSTSVLRNCFHLPNSEQYVGWTKAYRKDIQFQKQYWMNLNCIPSVLPPHMIFSLIILDPRLYLPKKRTKSVLETTTDFSCSYVLPKLFGNNPLWDSALRKIIKNAKISNAEMAAMRKNVLVPGSTSENKVGSIPILLIQRPGNKGQQNVDAALLLMGAVLTSDQKGVSTKYSKVMCILPDDEGYGSGWDIIMPSDWAQPIWVSLILWGARPGGLRESKSIAFQMDRDILPPDTEAGIEEENYETNKCKDIFFKLPPNKRTNYNKYRIASPFRCDWKLLVREWSENSDKDFFILRDKKILNNIQELLTSKLNKQLPDFPKNCLIPVSIKLSNKGSCNQFAIICLHQEGDVKNCPTEPNCVDKNEEIRKEMRKEHKTLLKKLRRRRIRGKRKGKVIPIDKEALENYTKAMRKLWLPNATSIRHSCIREVIGFVKHGDFSLSIGQSKAVGYIASGALFSLLSTKCTNKVLIRNANSKQYRLGTINVICDYIN